VSEEVHSRRPGLILHTHGLAALAVVPFVEFSQPVQFREFLQSYRGFTMAAGGDQRGDVESADEWSHASVVVVVRLVQRSVVVAPVRVPGLDDRRQAAHRPGIDSVA